MDAGVGEAMAISALIGAGVGGATSAATGQDPLKGALIGGIGGAVTGGAMGAFGGAGSAAATDVTAQIGTEIANMTAANASPEVISQALQGTYGMTAEQAAAAMAQHAATGSTAGGIATGAAAGASGGAGAGSSVLPGELGNIPVNQSNQLLNQSGQVLNPTPNAWGDTARIGVSSLPSSATTPGTFSEGFSKGIMDNAKPAVIGGLGIGALSAMQADQKKFGVPGQEHYDGPLSQFKYDPNTFRATYPTPPNPAYQAQYQNYRATPYAEGGITDIDQDYAKGGIAGLLKGRGDGMSDSIRATIADKQPARLADGEFVVPADVVSHLGNGSTDAGAKHLYKMMDKVRHARTGSKKQGRQIAAGGYLPA